MTAEELKNTSPQTFAFTESLNETQNFLKWESYHQQVFILMCEAAEQMASAETPMEDFYRIRERFFTENSEGLSAEDLQHLDDYSKCFLRYVEALRKAQKS